MKKVTKFASGFGCLISILGPLLAIVLYPTAKWMFALALVGVVVIALNILLAKDPTPAELADQVERLLTGRFGGMEVDHFEHLGVRDPGLREFWLRCMRVGLPETWVELDEKQKDELRNVIQELRQLGKAT